MKKSTIDFLNGQIENAKSENKSIDSWLKNGKWSRQVKAFLKNWLCDDVELERNGRTNTQMACDLVEELKQMSRHNEMRIAVANWYLQDGKTPVEFKKSLFSVMDFETAVENAISAITATDKIEFHQYFGNSKGVAQAK